MIVKGDVRSNGSQLADYLLRTKDNEKVTILDIDGIKTNDSEKMKRKLYEMDLTSELTKSKKSIYHAIIRPHENDRALTMDEWHRSADILALSLKMENQRRVVVHHKKKDGTEHIHVVFERYNHHHRRMTRYSYNYQDHNKAREQMEAEFNHKRTPQKNADRTKHQKTLTEIWRESQTASDFLQNSKLLGYQICSGSYRRPFRVIDNKGVSFDLVKQLDGVNTKSVRDKLNGLSLPDEKTLLRRATQIKRQNHLKVELTKEKTLDEKLAGDQQAEKARMAEYLTQKKKEFEEELINQRNREHDFTR